MISHENYEKRSLNMEYNRSLIALYNSTNDKNVLQVYLMGVGLLFMKDHLPDGTPCWRQPTQEEREYFEKEKTKSGI